MSHNIYQNSSKLLLRTIDGSGSYTYVAFADDASGNGFSLLPSGKAYTASIISDREISPLTADHFEGRFYRIGGDSTNTLIVEVVGSNNIDGTNYATYADAIIQVDDTLGSATIGFGQNIPKGWQARIEKHKNNSNEIGFAAVGDASITITGMPTLTDKWDQAIVESKGGNELVVRTPKV